MTSVPDLLRGIGLEKHAPPLLDHSIQKSQHLLECSATDLMQLGNLTNGQAHAVLAAAASKLAPAFLSMHDLLQGQQGRVRLPSGIPALDQAMGGGLLNGCITELVGPAGAQQA